MDGGEESVSGRVENGRRGRPFFRTWFPLCRPWSLAATAVPAFAAAAMCGSAAAFSRPRWWLSFAAAVPLQIACNLLNTWGDGRSGVDAAEGAYVSTPQLRDGLVSSRQVLAAAVFCLLLVCALGLPLLFYRAPSGAVAVNLPLAAIAAAGFAGATNYATGLRFKYAGLGVPFVFFLMGSLEIAGFWAASAPGAPVPFARILLLSAPVGCLVSVIMHGNDMRDISSDRAAGIRTVASILGPRGALALYFALHLVPYVFCAALFLARLRAPLCAARPLLCFAVLPLTAATLKTALRVYRENPPAPRWRRLERASGAIHLLFGAAYALALA